MYLNFLTKCQIILQTATQCYSKDSKEIYSGVNTDAAI